MYKSPITIIESTIDSFTKSIIKQKDDAIFAEIQHSFGVDMDREELIRALKYDRDQYNKGYADGRSDAVSHGMWHKYHDFFTNRQVGWICTNCSAVSYDLSNGDTPFCPHCGAMMDLEDDGDV